MSVVLRGSQEQWEEEHHQRGDKNLPRVELEAQWIHGSVGNVVYKLAHKWDMLPQEDMLAWHATGHTDGGGAG